MWRAKMAYSLGSKLENKFTREMTTGDRPWKMVSKSNKFEKKRKHRRERQRIRLNKNAPSEYGKYYGYEW